MAKCLIRIGDTQTITVDIPTVAAPTCFRAIPVGVWAEGADDPAERAELENIIAMRDKRPGPKLGSGNKRKAG